MDGKSNNEWKNRLTENARKKIKLTKIGIGKYVQGCIFDIWLNWERIGKIEGRRKKEGKKEERGIKGTWKEKEKNGRLKEGMKETNNRMMERKRKEIRKERKEDWRKGVRHEETKGWKRLEKGKLNEEIKKSKRGRRKWREVGVKERLNELRKQ